MADRRRRRRAAAEGEHLQRPRRGPAEALVVSGPWLCGQRCAIPAECFYEPNWESGHHVPGEFRRADGLPWGLAGLWNRWVDPASGEVHHSYAMLTQNADAHPLMRRMHRPDAARSSDRQDKRSVVPLAAADCATWLHGTADEARALIRLPASESISAGPLVP